MATHEEERRHWMREGLGREVADTVSTAIRGGRVTEFTVQKLDRLGLLDSAERRRVEYATGKRTKD